MSRHALLPSLDICYICESIIERRTISIRPLVPARSAFGSLRGFSSGRRLHAAKPQKSRFQQQLASKKSSLYADAALQDSLKPHGVYKGAHATEAELKIELQKTKTACNGLLSGDKAPSEGAIVGVLGQCKTMAELLYFEPESPSHELLKHDGPASALLSLDNSKKSKKARVPLRTLPETIQRMAEELSQLSYAIIKYPSIFISPKVLKLYVVIQAILQKPETLPEALKLYAIKPTPEEGTFPIKYSNQNPNKIRNAIPQPVADLALQTAINAKQLVVAMDIVESSYTTKAFHRNKFFRIALVPTIGLAAAPVAAYALASLFANLQDTMESGMATKTAFAGILAYVGFTTIIGVVAITTANDQMDRVTWAPGIPLRERWIREEERAAIDKIAGAWGFRETWRRGEEEGEEWDALREWIGRRAMMLDRVELMEGME